VPQGLPRRIKLAFVLQALIGSIVMSLGIVLGGLFVNDYLVDGRVAAEAEASWSQVAAGRLDALPRSLTIRGYFDPASGPARDTPEPLRRYPEGIHPLPGTSESVFVERRDQGTLYLVFDSTLLGRAVLWTGALALALSLLTMYLLSWLTYRTSKRLVTPVNWLAGVVSRWDPRAPDLEAIAPPRLPPDSGSEVVALSRALAGLGQRIARFVQRERDFTRDASHELRTPLTVIRVATDLMMAEPDVNARAHRSLARVQRAGRDMESVIDAFLILAREADVAPQTEEFAVRDVVEEEVERVRPLLAGKDVELEIVQEGESRLVAPPRVLHVILGNLLSNAARFTDAGRIAVHVYPGHVEVRDTGIGMAPDALSRAFDPFYRADPDTPNGKGMGLSIVRRLGERFGWPVELYSAEGRGTTAIVRFGTSAIRPA
jgi:signal transduction histidine kinase